MESFSGNFLLALATSIFGLLPCKGRLQAKSILTGADSRVLQGFYGNKRIKRTPIFVFTDPTEAVRFAANVVVIVVKYFAKYRTKACSLTRPTGRDQILDRILSNAEAIERLPEAVLEQDHTNARRPVKVCQRLVPCHATAKAQNLQVAIMMNEKTDAEFRAGVGRDDAVVIVFESVFSQHARWPLAQLKSNESREITDGRIYRAIGDLVATALIVLTLSRCRIDLTLIDFITFGQRLANIGVASNAEWLIPSGMKIFCWTYSTYGWPAVRPSAAPRIAYPIFE